jgi:hypothetical protein
MYNPDLALAYDMKEMFCDISDNTDMYEAQQDFEELMNSGLNVLL